MASPTSTATCGYTRLLDGHVRHCLAGKGDAPTPAEPEAGPDELMSAVGRLVR